MTGYWNYEIKKCKDNTYLGYGWRCSNCGCASLEKIGYPTVEHFCHHCGAEMIDEPTLSIREINNSYSWEEF